MSPLARSSRYQMRELRRIEQNLRVHLSGIERMYLLDQISTLEYRRRSREVSEKLGKVKQRIEELWEDTLTVLDQLTDLDELGRIAS